MTRHLGVAAAVALLALPLSGQALPTPAAPKTP